jgi:hypothetical protein
MLATVVILVVVARESHRIGATDAGSPTPGLGASSRIATLAVAGPGQPNPASLLPIQVPVRTLVELQMDVLMGRERGASLEDPSPWDVVLLGRYLAIDGLVARWSQYYGTDFAWQVAAYCFESALNPLAQGPDPGDRGVGQVGFDSERTARAWAGDRANPYFARGFDVRGDIWDPETNVVLSTITLRSLYAMPSTTSNERAYAYLTRGLSAVDAHGVIAPEALERVGGAESFLGEIYAFVGLKLAYSPRASGGEALQERGADSGASRLSQEKNTMLRALLAIDEEHADGADTYIALRDFYLGMVPSEPSIWAQTVYLSEAVNMTRLGAAGYRIPSDAAWGAVRDELASLEPGVRAADDADLLEHYAKVVASTAAGPVNP